MTTILVDQVQKVYLSAGASIAVTSVSTMVGVTVVGMHAEEPTTIKASVIALATIQAGELPSGPLYAPY